MCLTGEAYRRSHSVDPRSQGIARCRFGGALRGSDQSFGASGETQPGTFPARLHAPAFRRGVLGFEVTIRDLKAGAWWPSLCPLCLCQQISAGGDGASIKDAALSWLAAHSEELEAGRVLAALVRAGVSPKEYADHLRKWASLHKRVREASFFYCDWLHERNLLASAIANSVRAWLDEHAEWHDADFVLNAWLKHEKADSEVVRAGYERWMARHDSTREARIVAENWERATARERRRRQKI